MSSNEQIISTYVFKSTFSSGEGKLTYSKNNACKCTASIAKATEFYEEIHRKILLLSRALQNRVAKLASMNQYLAWPFSLKLFEELSLKVCRNINENLYYFFDSSSPTRAFFVCLSM